MIRLNKNNNLNYFFLFYLSVKAYSGKYENIIGTYDCTSKI